MTIGAYVLFSYLAIVNLATFLCYGVDKHRAKRNAWRIPERTLILLAFAGGCFGALLGMRIFRHKTKHAKFLILVPLSLVLWCIGLALAVRFLLAS